MGTIWVKELTGGLDVRRLPETTPGGVLLRATDGHITRGGEFEKRAAFVAAYALPAGTVSLAATKTGLVVFGNLTAPAGIPPGVTYQRLQHPTPSTALVRVMSYDLYGGKVYAVGLFADGSIYHFYDGARVAAWYDGRARASFRVTGGTGTSQLTDVKVNGVSIISGAITWATSNVATAAAIAAAINSAVTSPDYTATSVGDTVNIVAATAGAATNGFGVAFTVANALVLDPASGLVMTNGADTANTFTPGGFVRTIGAKVYSVSGSLLHYSGISQPTKWTTDAVGAGFEDLSEESSGSETLVSVARYQNLIAIFAATIVQIWFIDPDPKNVVRSQVLENTGTESPKSVTGFGDSDVFYLDESGLRSLRARDSSNSAATTDIGVPIDDLIVARLAGLSAEERRQIVGLVNPVDKRFWLIIQGTVYVFSFFQNAKVSAWTTYTLSTKPTDAAALKFYADDAVVFNRRTYIRAGDTVYVYGGLAGDIVYDNTEAEAWLPYLDANRPAAKKSWEGVDVALTGQWELRAATDPTSPETDEVIARPYETSYNDQRIPFQQSSSHVSLRFRSAGPGKAILSAAVIHYAGGEDED